MEVQVLSSAPTLPISLGQRAPGIENLIAPRSGSRIGPGHPCERVMQPMLNRRALILARQVDPLALQIHQTVPRLVRILFDELGERVQLSQTVLKEVFGGSHERYCDSTPSLSS